MVERRRPAPTLRVAPQRPGIVGWLTRELSELWAETERTPAPAKIVPAEAVARVDPLRIVVGAPVVPPPALLGIGPRESSTEEHALPLG